MGKNNKNIKVDESYCTAIVGIEIFSERMHIDKDFGKVLYKQIIAVLELLGNEVKYSNYIDLRLGVYLESHNPGTRFFQLKEKEYLVIANHFGHGFYKNLLEFGEREQRKGKDVLIQLNKGSISMDDFNNSLS